MTGLNYCAMIRILREKNTDYTVISNTILRDASVSLKAKGLMALVMSLPENWDFSINGVLSIAKEKRDCIYSIISELKEKGYCKMETIRDENGKIAGTDYIFMEQPMEVPQSQSASDILPYTEKPYTEKPYTEKPTQSIKELINYLNKSSKEKKEIEKYKKEKESSDMLFDADLETSEKAEQTTPANPANSTTKNKPTINSLDLSAIPDEFLPIVEDWLSYKKERHQTYKPRGFEAFFKRLLKLSGNNPGKAKEIVEQSIANNYAGIFPIKSSKSNLPVGFILHEENLDPDKKAEW